MGWIIQGTADRHTDRIIRGRVSLFQGFHKPSMTDWGLQDCLCTAFFSYGIGCLQLPRG